MTSSSQTVQHPHYLLYNLDDIPPLRHVLLYALQWIAYILGIVLVTIIVVGPGIGLSQTELVHFGSRVLVVTGLATLLQTYFGHGYPIIEGPGVLYWITYLYTFENAGSGVLARTEISGGILVAGTVVAGFTVTGLAKRFTRLLTPALLGTTLVLISLSFLPGSAERLLGISAQHPRGDLGHLTGVVLVLLTGSLVSLIGKGFVRTIPILLTAVASYLVYLLLGQVDFSLLSQVDLLRVPQPLAWGLPVFDPEVSLTFAIVGLLVTVNTFAAIEAAASVYGHEGDTGDRNHIGILMHGLSQVLVGLGAASGTASLAGSAAIVSLSRVGARITIAVAALVLIVLGFIPLFSALLATVPVPIVDGIFLLVLANLLAMGLDQYRKLTFHVRNRLIVGIPVMTGLVVTYLPTTLFDLLPFGGSLLFGNPIIVGTGVAILCENVIFGNWIARISRG